MPTFQLLASTPLRTFSTGVGTNTVLEASNAGFIKAHFDGLIPNEIAGITYDDIKLELPETKEYRYLFNGDPNSFANPVPYTDSI